MRGAGLILDVGKLHRPRPVPAGGRWHGCPMKPLIIVLLVAWLLLSLIGAVVEGLLWLLVIGAVLLAVTAAYGWFKVRRQTTE